MQRMMRGFLALSLGLVPTMAHAASGTAVFNGTVLATCTIAVGAAGVLDVSSNGTVLSTSGGGLGTPASATVLATGSSFRLGVSNPTSFTLAPTGGNSNVTFQTSYSTTGVTSATAVTSGVSTPLNIGTTNMSINLAATKSTAFPAGNYTAQTTITCD